MKTWKLLAGVRAPARVIGIAAMALAPAAQAVAGVETWSGPLAGRPVLGWREEAVPKQESAQAQLKYAAGLKLAMRGTEGESRDAARDSAVRAYRAVREYFEGDTQACAEAAFRAGELLRAAEDAKGALSEFKIARERGAETPFRVRAMLEIGHLQRRAGNLQEALAAYESASADAGASPGQKDDAGYWTGQVFAQQKKVEDALRTWQRVADGAEDPLDRVRAWDSIALAWVEKGDLEAAAGALERCREGLSEVAAEETRIGERVRNAIASMRAVDELQRAVEQRQKEGKGTEKKKAGGKKGGM